MFAHRVVAACVAVGVVAAVVQAQEDWIASDGDWFEASNWASGSLPGTNGAFINNGGMARIDSGVVQGSIAVGYGNPDVGFGSGDGHVVQTGGVVTLGPNSFYLLIGVYGGVRGEYELIGPGEIDAPKANVSVGREGDGVLRLFEGATATVSYLGVVPGLSPSDGPGHGEVTLDGAGTRLTVTSSNSMACTFGRKGVASCSITNGASLEASSVWFASGATESCEYEISGEGSALRVGGLTMYRNSVGLGHDFQTSGLGLEAGYTTLTIADGGVIERLEEDTELWFTMGGRAVLRGDGAIHADRIEIYTDGIVEPGVDGTGTLTLDGRVDLRETDAHPLPSGEILPEGGLVMDIAGVEQNDRVVMAGVELGGKLEISLVDGFVPQRGDVFEIITLTDQADLISPDPYQVGAFWHVLSPDLGVGVVLQPRYSIDKVELVAVCPADVNMDGIVNVDDIAGFAHDFLGNDATADLTRDGVVNFDDIQRFVDAYLGGCE